MTAPISGVRKRKLSDPEPVAESHDSSQEKDYPIEDDASKGEHASANGDSLDKDGPSDRDAPLDEGDAPTGNPSDLPSLLTAALAEKINAKIRRRALRLAAGLMSGDDTYGPFAKSYQIIRQNAASSSSSSTSSSSSSSGPPTKKKRPTKKSVKDTFDGFQDEVTHRTNTTFTGEFTRSGIARGGRHKADTRGLDLLNRLSQIFINNIHTQEIEAMAVNDRIVVSANERSAVTKILETNLVALVEMEKDRLEREKDRMGDDVSSAGADRTRKLVDVTSALVADDDGIDESADRGASQVARMAIDLDNFPAQAVTVASILRTIQNNVAGALEFVEGQSADHVASMINDDSHRWNIITMPANVTGNEKVCSHAEQNLLLALVKSEYRSGASIAGGKRPCTACWLSLSLVDKNGFNVTYNKNPGGLWKGSTIAGVFDLAKALGVDRDTLLAHIKGNMTDKEFKSYVSDLAKDAPHQTAIDDLPEAVNHKLYDTGYDTPPRSPDYDDSAMSPKEEESDDE